MIPAMQRLSMVAREEGWKNDVIHGMGPIDERAIHKTLPA